MGDTAETLEAVGTQWKDLPVLIICGHEDAITPVAKHEEMFELLGQAKKTDGPMSWENSDSRQLHILPGCGHFPVWEKPEAVVDILHNWMVTSTLGAGKGGG